MEQWIVGAFYAFHKVDGLAPFGRVRDDYFVGFRVEGKEHVSWDSDSRV